MSRSSSSSVLNSSASSSASPRAPPPSALPPSPIVTSAFVPVRNMLECESLPPPLAKEWHGKEMMELTFRSRTLSIYFFATLSRSALSPRSSSSSSVVGTQKGS